MGQKTTVNEFQAIRQSPECFHFVEKQIPSFDGIVEGVVYFIGLELVVLDEAVVGFGWEKEGGKEKRVYAVMWRDSCFGDDFSDVFQVVKEDIVPTGIVVSFEKFQKCMDVRLMKCIASIRYGPDI